MMMVMKTRYDDGPMVMILMMPINFINHMIIMIIRRSIAGARLL